MDRPALLLDVDGVLSLFGFAADRRPPGRLALVDGLPHLLGEAAAAARPLRDDFAIVWCTGWEERADEHLPQMLGLPRGLPAIGFDAHTAAHGREGGRHWKLPAIDAFLGPDRAAAWVDDGFDETCRSWAAHRRGPTRLVATDPALGLTATQAEDLRAWAAELAGGR